MGCDGGTIPRRDEMVKLKKKAEKAERDVELAAKWRHCALSPEKLKEPIVACDLGRLYNKESVLMALLDKSNIPEVASHIRNLKDVVELKLTVNPGYKPSDKADQYNDVQAAQYVCPVTGLEMSGRYRFAFLRGCGCVLSEKALKEVPSETCHKCGAPFKSEDVTIINGTEEDVKRQREAMEQRRLEAKQAKMAKRKRKTESPPQSGESSASVSDPSSSSASETNGSLSEVDTTDPLPAEKRPKLDTVAATTAAGATVSTCSSTSKLVKGSSKVVSKGSKLSSRQSSAASSSRAVNGHANGSSISTLRSGSSASVVVKRATQEVNTTFKSATKDPNARDAYKALFHSKDKERPKEKSAHWVTFFPYH